MGSCKTLTEDGRGISTTLVFLLLIVVTFTSFLVSYMWIMEVLGRSMAKTEHAIYIQSVVFDAPAPGDLTVYVQNIGRGSVAISDVYLDGVRQSISAPDLLGEGRTATIVLTPSHALGVTVKVKVTCTDGTFTEKVENSL